MKLVTTFETLGYPVMLRQAQSGKRLFSVVYGQQMKSGLTYAQACLELGACLLHAACCAGLASNEGA